MVEALAVHCGGIQESERTPLSPLIVATGWDRKLRTRVLSLLVAATLALAQTDARAAADSNALSFYKSLIDAIDSVQGTLDIYLSGGSWRAKVGARQVLWTVDDNTRATFTFNYNGGVLQDGAQISFHPPIHMWVLGGNADFSIGIRSVTFDDRGRFSDWSVFSDHLNNTNPATLGTMKQALVVSRSPKELFSGKLFAGFPNPLPCDAHGQACNAPRPMVTEVAFERTDATHPGLKIDFRPQKVIYFSHAQGANSFDDFVTVRTGGVEFDEIDYDVTERTLKGSLANFDVIAERGSINGRDLNLVLEPGSRLAFQFVNFRREPTGEAELDASSGTLSAMIGAGSRINLTTGIVNASDLILDSGSEANLQRFRFHVDDARSTDMRIGGGSSLKLNLRSGRLGFGQNGFVALGTGRIETNLSGDWNSADRPDATLQMTLVDVALTGGEVDLNAGSHVRLTAGNVKSSDLRFRGLEFAGLTGSFTDVNFQIDDNSQFGLPGGFRLITAPGAKLVAATPTSPMKLVLGNSYPLGSFHVDLPFRKLVNSSANYLSLTNGQALLNVTNSDDGSIVGDGSLHGDLVLQSGVGSLNATLEVYEARFEKKPQAEASFIGKVKATFQPGMALTVHTPFVKGYSDSDGSHHDDFRAFPLVVTASLGTASSTSEGSLSFTGSRIALAGLTLTPSFKVSLPSALGEHEDKNDENSANGEHPSDNDLKHAQEAIYDKFPLCDMHLYLIPNVYDFSSEMSLEISDDVVDLSLSQFRTTTAIAFKKDGCDLPVIGSILAAFIGGLFAGPGGAIVGGVVGYKAGHTLEEKLNDRVAAAIAERLVSMHREWHVHI